jgi:Rap1a immunity proteins
LVLANERQTGWAGACVGTAAGIIYADPKICAPDGWTLQQSVRVIVKYIEDRPARMHEPFVRLAGEALRAAWPCH